MAAADQRKSGGPPMEERPALASRLVWFVGLWVAGVAAISAVGLIIKLMLKG